MKCSFIDTSKKINSRSQKITYEKIHAAINTASAHQGTRIKLYKEDEEEYTVIFSWKDRNKWKIDYPILLDIIHKQRYVTHKQCLDLAKYIYEDNSIENLKGFTDVPVRHYTLDQMLEFKREDDLLLKGKDPDTEKPTPKPAPKPEKAKSIASVIPEKEIADTKPPTKTSSTPKGAAMPLGEGFQI